MATTIRQPRNDSNLFSHSHVCLLCRPVATQRAQARCQAQRQHGSFHLRLALSFADNLSTLRHEPSGVSGADLCQLHWSGCRVPWRGVCYFCETGTEGQLSPGVVNRGVPFADNARAISSSQASFVFRVNHSVHRCGNVPQQLSDFDYVTFRVHRLQTDRQRGRHSFWAPWRRVAAIRGEDAVQAGPIHLLVAPGRR
jgi:hypothetical protein